MHYGIVLRSYWPKKQRMAVLDQNLGRIEGINRAQTCCIGSYISYQPHLKAHYLYELFDLTTHEVALEYGRSDIYFFHHVLELCYYFLPLNCAANNVFTLVQFLCDHYKSIESVMAKKLFLLRFFTYLGYYPEGDIAIDVQSLLSMPLASMLEQTIDYSNRRFEQWLLSCVYDHPQKEQFKTIKYGIYGCKEV